MIEKIKLRKNTESNQFKLIQDRSTIVDLLNQGYTHREVKSITGVSLSSINAIAKFYLKS